MAADILSECFPESKIIIIFRDGRDVVDSKLDEESKDGWEIQLKKGLRTPLDENKILDRIKRESKYWKSLMELLLTTYERHHKDLRYKVKYEELRYDTLPELEKLYRFLEIPIDKSTINQIIERYAFEKIPSHKKGSGQFRRFASPGKWKENFSEEQIKVMTKLMGNTLQKLGY